MTSVNDSVKAGKCHTETKAVKISDLQEFIDYMMLYTTLYKGFVVQLATTTSCSTAAKILQDVESHSRHTVQQLLPNFCMKKTRHHQSS